MKLKKYKDPKAKKAKFVISGVNGCLKTLVADMTKEKVLVLLNNYASGMKVMEDETLAVSVLFRIRNEIKRMHHYAADIIISTNSITVQKLTWLQYGDFKKYLKHPDYLIIQPVKVKKEIIDFKIMDQRTFVEWLKDSEGRPEIYFSVDQSKEYASVQTVSIFKPQGGGSTETEAIKYNEIFNSTNGINLTKILREEATKVLKDNPEKGLVNVLEDCCEFFDLLSNGAKIENLKVTARAQVVLIQQELKKYRLNK